MSSANFATLLETFFTRQVDCSTASQSSHCSVVPGHVSFAAAICSEGAEEVAIETCNDGSECGAHWRVPRQSGESTGEYLSQPKCSPHSNPVLLSICGSGMPGALGWNPARTRDPAKAAIQPVSGFPDADPRLRLCWPCQIKRLGWVDEIAPC